MAVSQQRFSVDLPGEIFELLGLLNGDQDDSIAELVNLKSFYKYDPNDVPDEERDVYDREKVLANAIQDIYDKQRNDPYTKQIILNFGYFEIEIPIEADEDVVVMEDAADGSEEIPAKTKTDRYPLFTLPVQIERRINSDAGQYWIHFVDSEIQVNVGMLEPVLGDDLYFQLLEEMGKYEIEGRLSLPMSDLDVFGEIWHKLKAQLRLKDAKFDDNSFSLNEVKIALSPRANYFLAEDLAKLTQMSEKDFADTALTSWSSDDQLNVNSDVPVEKELFFPFLYDKYQLSTLGLLGNKASIIQGPPGTGKSETIANILCHLAATGKRVLFVSQKAQALKVVKDKLKKLDVKYLYGYLPNPNSAQIGEEDEADGIAPQLSALGAHIVKLSYGFHAGKYVAESSPATFLENVVTERDKCRNSINGIIAAQRKYYQLSQELLGLKEYDLGIYDFACFEKNFSVAGWQEIKSIKDELRSLGEAIEVYEGGDQKNKLNALLSSLDMRGRSFSDLIGRIRDDVAATGYDRHSNFFRVLNNMSRNFRLAEARNKLPREIIDFIDKMLAGDATRIEASKALDELYNYCRYYEDLQALEKAIQKLKNKLAHCGVSDQEFNSIDGKIISSDPSALDAVKKNILRVRAIKTDLRKLAREGNVNTAGNALRNAEQERAQRVASYIQNIIDRGVLSKWQQGVTIKQIIAKLSKAFGKSKKAFKTFDNLRKDSSNFNAVLDLIPIWIMELDDASRIIPLEAGLFDYVILDEASQCNVAYTLPVMFRAARALFVGDSEQMRDGTIMFKSNRVFDELARKYQIPEERQIKATGSAVQSVLDIAYQRGFMSRPLLYHYRSPVELIGFSNKYFYVPKGKELISLNSNYLTYKDTNRVMLVHQVDSDWSEEISDNVNVAEAKAILRLFREMRADDRYRDKSVGILSFFNAQASFIRDLFEEAGYKEEEDNYKVSIIEGIQGDEKDIVIYSFVIRTLDQKRQYVPLTGEGGDIKADINKGRVNVAFSRARLQTHCFVSMLLQDIPDKIWLKKYIEYVQRCGEITFYSTDLKPFDSYFEEEFYHVIKGNLKSGYIIQNQVASCGFKIDFVISNVNTGKRIAVECDGPCHFKDEIDETYGIHVESDEERQRVLEAAKWNFYRIKYADWTKDGFDKATVVHDIVELLQ